MNIAIIGAGNVGGAVARGVVKAGHTAVLTATDPEHARAAADQAGVDAATDVVAAVRDADVVVLAVPYTAVADLAAQLGDAVDGKVVVDATNPLKEDLSGVAVSDRSGAEEVAALLSGARVVKALNTVFAANQADGNVDGTVLDGLYAGDDDAAKATVRDLLAAIGFRPVDAGPLARSLALEHMAFLNISLNAANGWAWRSGWNLVGPVG